MLDKALESLKAYDWGQDLAPLQPIDDAVVSTHGDEDARRALEEQLVAALKGGVGRAARDFICRKLMVIGTAASVPALAEMLSSEEDSHMARYALERIPAPEAAQALRYALPALPTALRIGVMSSLGARQDEKCVDSLAQYAGDADPAVASAAAGALGAIRTPQAAKELASLAPTDPVARQAVTDASLACAESLLASNDKAAALVIYKRLSKGDQPKHVRLAATQGVLACASK